jgi:hypothetical protein
MAKKRGGDAEFGRQFEKAAVNRRRRAEGSRTVTVFYDGDDDSIIVEFSTGGSVEMARALLDELEGNAPADLA